MICTKCGLRIDSSEDFEEIGRNEYLCERCIDLALTAKSWSEHKNAGEYPALDHPRKKNWWA